MNIITIMDTLSKIQINHVTTWYIHRETHNSKTKEIFEF